MKWLRTLEPLTLSALRIMTGLLFMEHGTGKLFGFPSSANHPAFLTLGWFAGILECFGGALVAGGLLTRPVAFLLSGEMAIGYFMVHAPKSFFPLINGGDAAVLYCFIFLYLSVAGPGPFSLDRFRGRSVI
ncbi:MAG: DoxX family protein [Acetobacteraceae bacterium]|nr:DoxX family protein [Acetobacteraceae bacterium]